MCTVELGLDGPYHGPQVGASYSFLAISLYREPGQKSGRGLIFCLPRRGAARFNLCVSVPPEMSGLSHGELQELVVKLLGKVTDLERTERLRG
jgi:hypothetical protein